MKRKIDLAFTLLVITIIVVSILVIAAIVVSIAQASLGEWSYRKFYSEPFGDSPDSRCGPWSSDDVELPHRHCGEVTFDADGQKITLLVKNSPVVISPGRFRALFHRNGGQEGRWGFKVTFRMRWGDPVSCYIKPARDHCTTEVVRGIGNVVEYIDVVSDELELGWAKLVKAKFKLGVEVE